jgi:hypothetical protein
MAHYLLPSIHARDYLELKRRSEMNNNGHRRNRSVMMVYDLCLNCAKACKRKGSPWCRLECPSFSGGVIYRNYRVANMTERELVSRIAYA